MSETISQNERAVIGIDLGGTKLAAALFAVSDSGQVRFIHALGNINYKTYFDREQSDGLTAEGKSKLVEEALLDAINALREKAGDAALSAIGIATAGFVEQGFVIEAWNIGMKNYPLQRRISEAAGVVTYLYKDAWAPIYAVGPEKPSIIFSIGTGFGGVSCGPDLRVSARSYTARKKIVWIPYLCFSDDPGYAASFSTDGIDRVLATAFEKCKAFGNTLPDEKTDATARFEMTGKIRDYAKETGKMSPSKMELFVARALAPKAAFRVKPDEVFADSVCSAAFAGKTYGWISGKEIEPQELDRLAAAGDAEALAAFHIQAEFVAWVLALIQKERIDLKLPPAEVICATGSGYNDANASVLGPSILHSLKLRCEHKGIKAPSPDNIELIKYADGDTTLACYGAAVGAAKGIVQE